MTPHGPPRRHRARIRHCAPTTTATAPSSLFAGTDGLPLLVTDDGTQYFDGRTKLDVLDPAGRLTSWPLPPIANGRRPGRAPRAHAPRRHALPLQPARPRACIRPTPDKPEPFEVEATFTSCIPSTPKLTRVWPDPAGRIIKMHGREMSILFPDGYIPPKIVRR